MKRLIHAVPLLLMTALAACAENPAQPEAVATPGRRASVTPASPFQSARVKYSDAGAKPATGRSGSAVIEARALLGADGQAQIEVTTGSLDTDNHPGKLTKVQLKSFNAAGEVIRTSNFNGLNANGYWTHSTAQLGHNAPIQVQTNIKGIDPKRTDVVTVATTVLKRPDIAALSLSAPARVYTGQPVNIVAVMKELNGDVGANGSCVLSVDGAQVDAAPVVWIDAGSSVSCQFSQTWSTAGSRTVAVAFTGAVPGEWSTANNSANGSVEVVLPVVDLNWSASADSWQWSRQGNDSYSYDYCWYNSYNCQWGARGKSVSESQQGSSFNFYAATNEAAAVSPLNVAFTMSSGTTLGGTNLSQLDVQNGCIGTYDPGTGTHGQICSSGTTTSAQFHRSATAVTYYSYNWWYEYNRYTNWYYSWYVCGYDWLGYPYYCYYEYPVTNTSYYDGQYTNTNDYQTGDGSVFALGGTVTASLVIEDATGRKFQGGGTFQAQNGYGYTEPSSGCSYYYYYNEQSCWNYTTVYASKFASATGTGMLP